MRVRVDSSVLRQRRFHRAAAAWFAEASRRLALARLHGQMARLTQAEVDEIDLPYRKRPPLTKEERGQIAHLESIGRAACDWMDRLAPHREGSFYSFAFDYPDAS